MMRKLGRLSRPESIFFAWSLVFAVACLDAIPAQAGIISSSGVTLLGGPPAPSVAPGAQLTAPNPIVFPEVLGGVAATGVPVDHLVTGDMPVTPVTTGGVVNPILVDGLIAPGTPFDSYLFHFDPADSGIPSALNFYPSSNILFSTQILGLQLFSNGASLQKPALTPYIGKLEAGDAVVFANGGPPLAYYPGGLSFRGLEEDAVGITSGGFGISLAGKALGVEIDQIRIFVSTVPEPASLAMAFVAVFAIMGLGRTRSRVIRS
jgi:hypothetical protein